MSLVNLAHVCSHLQNATKARLGITSIPVSKLHVALMLGLQKQGFISSVTLGGPTPPTPFLLQAKQSIEASAEHLSQEPWDAFPEPDQTRESPIKDEVYEVDVPQNPGKRRLWLGLKYWNNEPVLSKMKLESKPTKRIWLNSEALGRIVRGRESSFIKGLTRPGECLFVSTDRGIMEARECAEKKIGGMVLCRVL
ncbi:ribosomal protein S8 [Lepidopterella palustris CBS 459.81]|uniref:Ribosomal protein S8 n=1 Tax=Lepidopterella palustris CBS 459.81 TaxID=1314670 RepID=A0A8E2JDH2_9PEZI|nr:ribosomal protein S8 [Lepidopterella palustris CBS 459.81]